MRGRGKLKCCLKRYTIVMPVSVERRTIIRAFETLERNLTDRSNADGLSALLIEKHQQYQCDMHGGDCWSLSQPLLRQPLEAGSPYHWRNRRSPPARGRGQKNEFELGGLLHSDEARRS